MPESGFANLFDTKATFLSYDESGRLIGEYDSLGAVIQETVYFNGAPVAVLQGSNIYYVHTDHLGTPRVITESDNIVWRWESDPFGTTLPDEDPDGDQTTFEYNLRFPGQYYDEETGLHYNYFRTYDPSTGRYLESDPIGLGGGLNTYIYANVSPLGFSDFYGLDTLGIGIRNPRPGAVNDGVFNPRIDPGHTVAYLKDNDGNIYETASVGPTAPVGPLNKNDFQEGRIPATARYPIQGEFEIFEWPGIEGDQLNQCKKAFSEMIKNPGNFTPTNQCTSAAIDLANSCGLDVPSGVSPIRVPSYVPFVDPYENNLPNPVGLNLRLRLKKTSKTVDGSELKRN